MRKSKKLIAVVLAGAMMFAPLAYGVSAEASYVHCINMRCPTYGYGVAPHDNCSKCNRTCCRTCNYGHADWCADYGVKY